MNKIVSAERIYSLGDYQNVKFSDSILEIPDTILQNSEAMKRLRYLQLVDIEWSYLKYMQLRAQRPQGSLEEALEFVEQERTRTFEELLAHIK